jgi:uncharacterized membrane protein
MSRNTSLDADDWFSIWLIALIWPLFALLGIPVWGQKFASWRDSRKEAREVHRIRVEAETKVIREERQRGALYRPHTRKLQLGKGD